MTFENPVPMYVSSMYFTILSVLIIHNVKQSDNVKKRSFAD